MPPADGLRQPSFAYALPTHGGPAVTRALYSAPVTLRSLLLPPRFACLLMTQNRPTSRHHDLSLCSRKRMQHHHIFHLPPTVLLARLGLYHPLPCFAFGAARVARCL